MLIALMIQAMMSTAGADCAVWSERIDVYDPISQAHLGHEVTDFAFDGRRLQFSSFDTSGQPSLIFLVRHDGSGREHSAVYFEGDALSPSQEFFVYSEDGRTRLTAYGDPQTEGERTESLLDEAGREVRKRYFNQSGDLYGVEDVFWTDEGWRDGWDFQYTRREGGASFRYEYDRPAGDCGWQRRIRTREGVAERLETRSLLSPRETTLTPLRFAAGIVSTDGYETSPSFSETGRRMVFARYADSWARKTPFLAELTDTGWEVRPIAHIGTVYNLSITPDGQGVVYSDADDGRMWLAPVDPLDVPALDLTSAIGATGSYPQITASGDLVFYAPNGAEGAGIYLSDFSEGYFQAPMPLETATDRIIFDGHQTSAGELYFTQCSDDICEPGPGNGIFVREDAETRRIDTVGYAWGATPVPSLGLLVFTDGEDILSVPLSAVDDQGVRRSDRP